MKRTVNLILAISATLYVLYYLLLTQTYKGQFDDTPMEFRLVNNKFEYYLIIPIFSLHKLFKGDEFYLEIKNGAGLPPALE